MPRKINVTKSFVKGDKRKFDGGKSFWEVDRWKLKEGNWNLRLLQSFFDRSSFNFCRTSFKKNVGIWKMDGGKGSLDGGRRKLIEDISSGEIVSFLQPRT